MEVDYNIDKFRNAEVAFTTVTRFYLNVSLLQHVAYGRKCSLCDNRNYEGDLSLSFQCRFSH